MRPFFPTSCLIAGALALTLSTRPDALWAQARATSAADHVTVPSIESLALRRASSHTVRELVALSPHLMPAAARNVPVPVCRRSDSPPWQMRQISGSLPDSASWYEVNVTRVSTGRDSGVIRLVEVRRGWADGREVEIQLFLDSFLSVSTLTDRDDRAPSVDMYPVTDPLATSLLTLAEQAFALPCP